MIKKNNSRLPVSINLNRKEMTTVRESLYRDRLLYDLKFAAIHCGLDLQVMQPEVDNHGYDISIDDGDRQRFFQLKVTTKTSGTSSWEIHKRLLRPDIHFVDHFNLGAAPDTVGLNGGVILTFVDDTKADCPISYYYFDYFIFAALHNRMILDINQDKRFLDKNVTADKTLTEMHTGVGREKIDIHKSLFLRVKDTHSLLAISGFHSSIPGAYLLENNVAFALRDGWLEPIDGMAQHHKHDQAAINANSAAEKIIQLVDDKLALPQYCPLLSKYLNR